LSDSKWTQRNGRCRRNLMQCTAHVADGVLSS
jgi:hypothetical protein